MSDLFKICSRPSFYRHRHAKAKRNADKYGGRITFVPCNGRTQHHGPAHQHRDPGVKNLEASGTFYVDGLGWKPHSRTRKLSSSRPGEWFSHSFCLIHWPRTFWPIQRPLDEQPLSLATNV